MRRDFVEIRAYCKINLALDILRLREDGYHEVEMILQTIPLWDTVTLRRTAGSEWRKPVTITSNAQWLPQDEKNTAYRAAYLLARDFCRVGTGTEIHIDKKVPRCGGLGGSSADAAAVRRNGTNYTTLGFPTKRCFGMLRKLARTSVFAPLRSRRRYGNGDGAALYRTVSGRDSAPGKPEYRHLHAGGIPGI